MSSIITPDTVSLYTHSNSPVLPVRGIVVSFHGLGGFGAYPAEGTPQDRHYAERGVLHLSPEYGPWNWMNDASVSLVDHVLDVWREKLGPALPLVVAGGSMGGHAALAYLLFGRHKAAACAVNCPVCDLTVHFSERPDVPRTLYSAYGAHEEELMETLRRRSPVYRAEDLPDIPYFIAHTMHDQAVSKQRHSDPLVARMRELGRQVEFVELEKGGHCELGAEAGAAYDRFILRHAGALDE